MLFGNVRITYPNGREETLPLTKPTVRVGRSVDGSDIVLNDSQVSRQHAEIQCNRQSIHVMDLGSANGVWLDGERLAPHRPVEMTEGSTFTIGRVRFELLFPNSDSLQAIEVGATSMPPPTASEPPARSVIPTTFMVPSSKTIDTPPAPEPAADLDPPPDAPAPPAEPATGSSTTSAQQIALTADPVDVDIEAGEPTMFTIMATNRSSRVDAAVLRVDGIPGEWIEIKPIAVIDEQGQRHEQVTVTPSGGISLLPGRTGELRATICPPRSPLSQAGNYQCIFYVFLAEQQQINDQVETTITIKPFVNAITTLTPSHQNTRLRGHYRLGVDNQGNSPLTVDLRAQDREDLLHFDFRPKQPTVQPNTQALVHIYSHTRARQWFGKQHTYPFTIAAVPTSAPGQERQHHGELTLRRLRLWPIVLALVLIMVALLLQPIVDFLRPVPVHTALNSGPMIQQITLNGRLVPLATVGLSFERDGLIEAILPAGTVVKKDDQIAQLRYYEQLRAIRLAEDNLQRAQTDLENARKQNQLAVKEAQIQLDKAKAEAQRLAAGGSDDPARAAQRVLATAQREARNASADASIVKLSAEDQVTQAMLALQEAQQKRSRAKWELEYVQKNGTDPNFVSEETNSNDAAGDPAGSSTTEAPKLNNVQKQAFVDAVDTAQRALEAAQTALTAALHERDRAHAVEITANNAANADVQTAQEQLDALNQGERTPAQIAAQSALDAAQLKLDALGGPDLTPQLKAVADAEQALNDARDKLTQSTILAPADGRVISTAVLTGDLAQMHMPVVQLAVPDTIEVVAELTDAQIKLLSPPVSNALPSQGSSDQNAATGTPRRIEIALPNQGSGGPITVAGTLRRLEIAAAGASGATAAPATNRAYFTFAEPDKVAGGIGDLASVTIITTISQNARWVTPDFVRTDGDRQLIRVRRVLDLLIVKIPYDQNATAGVGLRNDQQVEITNDNKLESCPQPETPILSNRDIPNKCRLIIDSAQ